MSEKMNEEELRGEHLKVFDDMSSKAENLQMRMAMINCYFLGRQHAQEEQIVFSQNAINKIFGGKKNEKQQK